MKKALLVALALIPLASACNTTGKVASIPGIGFSTEKLKRSEYEILGSATSEACAEESCNLFTGCSRKANVPGEELMEGRMFSTDVSGVETRPSDNPFAWLGLGDKSDVGGSEIAERIAMYKAIESVPTADAIILPRKSVTVEKSDFLGLFTSAKSCVKLSGKAVRLKADGELPKN